MFNFLDSNSLPTYYLLSTISLAILWILPISLSIYIIVKFCKKEYDFSYINKILVSIEICLFVVVGIINFVTLLYYLDVMLVDNNDIPIAVLIIGIVLVIIAYTIIFVASQYLTIGIGKDGIDFFGEHIRIEKIKCIVNDTNLGDVYVIYLEGTKRIKKLKFSRKVIFSEAILEHATNLNTTVINGNIKEIFKKIWNETRGIDLNSETNVDKKDQNNDSKD